MNKSSNRCLIKSRRENKKRQIQKRFGVCVGLSRFVVMMMEERRGADQWKVSDGRMQKVLGSAGDCSTEDIEIGDSR